MTGEFTEWMKTRDIHMHDTFRITSTQSKGTSISTTHRIPNSTHIATVPLTSSLSLTSIHTTSQQDATLSQALACITCDEKTVIVLFLVYCRWLMRNGGNNNRVMREWMPWINMLPNLFNTPVFYYTHTDMEPLLKGTGLDTACAAKEASLCKLVDVLRPALDVIGCDHDDDDDNDDTVMEDVKWADGIVRSRVMSFASKYTTSDNTHVNAQQGETQHTDDLHIVPLIDFCNHATDANATWDILPQSESQPPRIVLVATRDINANEEVCISYGVDKTNTELLFVHGFCLDDAEFCVTVPAPFVEYGLMTHIDDDNHNDDNDVGNNVQSHSEQIAARAYIDTANKEMTASVDAKKKLLGMLGLPNLITLHAPVSTPTDPDVHPNIHRTETLPLVNPTRGILSDDALLTLYICMMTKDDGFKHTPTSVPVFEVACVPVDPLDKPTLCTRIMTHPHTDVLALRVWTVMIQTLTHRIQALDPHTTTHEHDNHCGGEGSGLCRVEQVVALRAGQRRTLERAIEVFESLQLDWSELESVCMYLAHMLAE